ncbi:hypothetical protein B0I31_106274 [Saccharothrix carnea]|uniref:Type VII secretion system (Wss) protein ESAT-6 n=1 Tax=Saccharothrix carnea TaxID=1280637 RepID=A0A2P8I8H1_SACCR|nr:WXG100 family type VII secretion target [Saccharothrix carnea]PSL54758.1 hypothetical protein B0I31_106274 [Saccharothrix carnea]
MRGKDGRQIAAEVGPELDYLSGISRRLGVRDLVADYFTPVVGDWNDLQEEAERWRKAGLVAEHVTRDLTKPLGKLDSAWQGKDADAFVEHMQKVGLAGHDMSDAMHAMGEALDQTAEGIRGIVQDMSRVFAEAAETVSGAAALPLDGDRRVVEALDELHDPAKELHESVRDVLEAFLRLCDGVSGSDDFADVKMEHPYPEQNWTFTAPAKPGAPEPLGTTPPADTKPAGSGGSGGGVPGGGGGGVPGGGGGVPGGGGLPGGDPAERMQPGGSTGVSEPRPVEPGARPAAAAAAGPGGPAAGGAGMMGAGMMGGMGAGGQQGGDKEHKSKVQLAGSTEQVFGKPKKSAPPVLGED